MRQFEYAKLSDGYFREHKKVLSAHKENLHFFPGGNNFSDVLCFLLPRRGAAVEGVRKKP